MVAEILAKIRKSKLARRIIDRAAKIAESLPEGGQHYSVFRCYTLKGCIHNQMREYATAIKSLEHALVQLPKVSDEVLDKFEELECRNAIAIAYFYERSYKDALTSMYDALSVIKDLFPEGSESEAELCLWVAVVAQKIKNKSLEVSNLRLTYKMYSKILGETHYKTKLSYIRYAEALIRIR
jgi:tetratricopeptide (TPR) repeat protein